MNHFRSLDRLVCMVEFFFSIQQIFDLQISFDLLSRLSSLSNSIHSPPPQYKVEMMKKKRNKKNLRADHWSVSVLDKSQLESAELLCVEQKCSVCSLILSRKVIM